MLKMIERLFMCSATLIGGLLPTMVMAQVPNFGDPVPGLILNVQLAPSSGGFAGVIHTGALQSGVEGFVDRTNQQWTGIPSQLIGSDYVQMAQDNADVHPFAVDVTVVEGTILHLIIPEHDHLLPFAWMSESVFGASWVNTGAVITSPWASAAQIWSTGPLRAGTYRFGELPLDPVRGEYLAFYNIAATLANLSSLVVDFGAPYGLWVRRETTWSQLNPRTAEAIIRIDGGNADGLIIDFGPGVGLWFWGKEQNGDEIWFQLNTGSPTEMVGVDLDSDGETDAGVFSFPGQGLWLYVGDDEQWVKLHPFNASHLAAADLDGDGGEDVIVDFPGYGLWVLYGGSTWAQLHPFDVSTLATVDLDGNGSKDVVMTFPGHGVWSYRGAASWSLINPRDATRLAAGDLDGNGVVDLVIDFGASVGVWVRQNGTTWWQLNTLTSEGITTGDLDNNGHNEVILDFGGAGVWSYEDLGGWQQVHTLNPKTIVTGRLF